MTNVLHHQIQFPTQPVGHSPSPFAFSFGLNPLSHTHAHTQPAINGSTRYSPPAPTASGSNSGTSARQSTKRRHEPEQGGEDAADSAMNVRSPSPSDRPKRLLVKRLRVTEESSGKTSKEHENDSPDNVDVGLLLASLPSQSLLPILSSLLVQQPSLKPLVVSLIPRPTLDAALGALDAAIQKLREAQPYSQPTPTVGLFGFGPTPTPSANAASSSNSGQGGMRDSYIQSRLRPFATAFASTALSYLSYFSSNPNAPPSPTTPLLSKVHPSETFTYLHTVASHIHRLSPLVRTLLANESPQLGLRLSEEWDAWVGRVDEHVNRHGRMLSGEVVKGWERHLEEMVGWDSDRSHGATTALKSVQEKWMSKVGWLTGRNYGGGLHMQLGRNHSIMDED